MNIQRLTLSVADTEGQSKDSRLNTVVYLSCHSYALETVMAAFHSTDTIAEVFDDPSENVALMADILYDEPEDAKATRLEFYKDVSYDGCKENKVLYSIYAHKGKGDKDYLDIFAYDRDGSSNYHKRFIADDSIEDIDIEEFIEFFFDTIAEIEEGVLS